MYITPALIESLERRFGGEVWISGDLGEQANVRCPFCTINGMTQDLSGHLGLNFRIGKCHCVRCGWGHGSLSKFLEKHGGISVATSIGDVRKELFGFLKKPMEVRRRLDVGAEFPAEARRIGRASDPCYWESLQAKGIEWEEMRQHYLSYSIQEDGYVLFPFFEAGEIVYWQGRAARPDLLSDPKKKKRNPPTKDGLGKACWLYGIDDIEEGMSVYLVEGTLDKISLDRWLRKELGDAHRAVSLQGTSLSFPGDSVHPLNTQWGKIVSKKPKEVNIVFDPDAFEKAQKLASVLQMTGLLSRAIRTFGKDPNEAIQKSYDDFTKSFKASIGNEISELEYLLSFS